MTNKVSSHVLSDTAVGAGTYGGTTQLAVFTVDSQGRLTYAANATPSIATSQLTGTINALQVANNQTYGVNITGSSGSTTGNAGTVTNGVYSVGNQTITGTKTFNSKIIGSISGNADGNAGTVTNGVYTNGSYADPAWITSLSKSKVGLGNVDNTADANKSVSYAATAGSATTAGNGGVTSLTAGKGISLSSSTGGITISSGKMSSSIGIGITSGVPNPTLDLYSLGWTDLSASTFTSNGDPTIGIGSLEITCYTNDTAWQSAYFQVSMRAIDTSTGATHTAFTNHPVTLIANAREGSTLSANLIYSPAFRLTTLVNGRSYKWQISGYFGKLNSSGVYVSWASSTQAVTVGGTIVAFEI